MRLRKASGQDAAALVALEATCFPGDAWSIASVQGHLASQPCGAWLIEDGLQAVAYALAGVSFDVAELHRVGVIGSARRQGLADRLLEAVVEWGRQERANRLLLEVSTANSLALEWYAKREFVEVNRRARYYRDGSDAVMMRRGLGIAACGGRKGTS